MEQQGSPSTAEIFEAIKDGDINRIDEFLSQYPQLITAKSENGETLFILSVYYGRDEIKDLLLAKGYKPDHHEAAASNNINRLKELIILDEDLLNSFSADGFTPLGLACYFGHLPIVKYLLEKGAEVNTPSNNNFRVMPLHSAVANKNIEISELLLEHGAEINVRQQQDFTPLHQAAYHGHLEMVKLLLKHNADKEARTKNGLTPLDMAVEKQFDAVVRLLID